MINRHVLLIACLYLSLFSASPDALTAAGRVVTVAGNGRSGYTGDGGPASRATIGGPFGVSLGPDGALYFCEIDNHCVRRIDRRTGLISTVAGNGKPGYAGDGGPATRAACNEPYEVRFDAVGNMYFVEMKNHLVRRVDARTHTISTVAGTGKPGFSGDGGPATSAQLKAPHSIALDERGNLYICDIGNHRIRRVHLGTGIISTLAGTGEKRPTPDGARLKGTPLNGPRALDYAGNDQLVLALREGNAVYRIDLDAGTLHHIGGTGEKGYSGDGGDARAAKLSGPKGIAVGPHGDIYLADTESHTIRVIRKKTRTIHTLVGDGKMADGPDGNPAGCRLGRPHGIYVDAKSRVYIGDSSNHRIRVLEDSAAIDSAAIGWKRLKLDERFRAEGVAVFDVNRDGFNDVIAGDVWYAGPKWTVHEIRKPGDFVAGKGYSNCFAMFGWDINRDGWQDVFYIGFPGDPFHWYQNPGRKGGHWKQHIVWSSICNESPEFEDLDGDGLPELIFGSQPESQMGYVSLPGSKLTSGKWPFRAISRKGDPMKNGTFKYYHGLGIGDINRDGRADVVIPHGWWEAPAEPTDATWRFHPLHLAKDASSAPLKAANIYIDDYDLDGDNDLVMSSAHTFGVWWFENIGGNERPRYKYHLIDEMNSQTHAMEWVDLTGNGTRDLVTGKRFFAHNGSDPGGKDPVKMYWYEVQKRKGAGPKFVGHEIKAGLGTGVGTQFLVTDVNGDGLADIALSNKKGVNVLLQKR
jgi:streptogramin lyase